MRKTEGREREEERN